MNVLYNSDNYYVVEFPGHCGVELVDKQRGRGAFLEGAVGDEVPRFDGEPRFAGSRCRIRGRIPRALRRALHQPGAPALSV